MILFALFVVAVFAVLGVFIWLMYQDRVREEHQRWELMHPSSEGSFWKQYEIAELKQMRDDG